MSLLDKANFRGNDISPIDFYRAAARDVGIITENPSTGMNFNVLLSEVNTEEEFWQELPNWVPDKNKIRNFEERVNNLYQQKVQEQQQQQEQKGFTPDFVVGETYTGNSMETAENALREQAEKENAQLIQQRKEEEEFIRSERAKEEQAALEKEKEEVARVRENAETQERIKEQEAENRLREQELYAARNTYKSRDFVDSFVDEVSKANVFILDTIRDTFIELKDNLFERVEYIKLALQEENAVKEQAKMQAYIENMPENSWERQFAENLVREGDAKSVKQLDYAMKEYVEFANTTDIKEYARLLNEDPTYRKTWTAEFVNDLVAEGKVKTIAEAIERGLEHEKLREQDPDLAKKEDIRVLMKEVDRDLANPALSNEEREALQGRRERMEAAFNEVDRQRERQEETERKRDNFELHEKFKEEKENLTQEINDIDVSRPYNAVAKDISDAYTRLMDYQPEYEGWENDNEYAKFFEDTYKLIEQKEKDLHEISVEKAKNGDEMALDGLRKEYMSSIEFHDEKGISKEELLEQKKEMEAIEAEYNKAVEQKAEVSKEKMEIQEGFNESLKNQNFKEMSEYLVKAAKKDGISSDKEYEERGIARTDEEKDAIERRARNKIMRGVDNSNEVIKEIKVHWEKVEGCHVAYDVEVATGDKEIHSYNNFSIENAWKEVVSLCNEFSKSREREREQERGMDLPA